MFQLNTNSNGEDQVLVSESMFRLRQIVYSAVSLLLGNYYYY